MLLNYYFYGSIAVNLLLLYMVLQKHKFANRDPLTGLFNIRAFERLFTKVKAKYKTEGNLCIAFIDIDFFKQVNDTHGHLTGDQILINLSQRIVNNVREHDVVVRYGGEEFIVLLADCDSMQAVQIRTE